MSKTFEAQLHDPTSSLAVSLVAGAPTLLVAFGGIFGALGVPPFEFFNQTRTYAVSRVFVRDLRQAWYHDGLPGVSVNIRTTALILRDLLRDARAERVVFIGNSMGGYAALVFAALLDATEVHAFAPQTFIDAPNRASQGDERWPEQMARVHASGDASLFDLLPLLRDYRGGCRFVLHYSAAEMLDRIHAERLASCAAVGLCAHEHSRHNVVKHLRDTGKLAQIVLGAATGGGSP